MRSSLLFAAALSVSLGAPAFGAPEPFDQETVETRPLRNPKTKPQHRHGHAGHRHGHSGAGHAHDRGHASARPGRHYHRHGAAGSHAGQHGPSGRAGRSGQGEGHDHDQETETENLFGFTLGSDTEEKGAKGIALETVGRFGKRDGTYAAISKKLEFSYGLTDDISVSLGLLTDYHGVLGVTGLDDVKGFNFNGIGTELRWRLAKRGPDAVGVTVHIEPSWQRIDEVTGLRGTKFGSENKLIFDSEPIKDRLFAAFNLLYELERVRENASPDWENGSKVGFALAGSVQVAPKLFVGAEVRYLRAYEGLLPETFLGDAVYVGPTLLWHFASNAWISAAWNVQIAGHEVGNPLRLDLTNFERHQARVKVGIEF